MSELKELSDLRHLVISQALENDRLKRQVSGLDVARESAERECKNLKIQLHDSESAREYWVGKAECVPLIVKRDDDDLIDQLTFSNNEYCKALKAQKESFRVIKSVVEWADRFCHFGELEALKILKEIKKHYDF